MNSITIQMCKEIFKEISEGNIVSVDYRGGHLEGEAVVVTEQDGKKIVSFDIPQTEPKLVTRMGSVYLETRPMGRPQDWSAFTKVDNIEIVE